jgi:hypothetical protein
MEYPFFNILTEIDDFKSKVHSRKTLLYGKVLKTPKQVNPE